MFAMSCTLCPRNCAVNRRENSGICKTGEILVSRIGKHYWEEPCISGDKGSGAVFFGGCNLHCRFCQNYDISVKPHGIELTAERLADVMLYLQDSGAANVNLVTPAHFSDKIAAALTLVKSSLKIPVVYNTNSYEKVSALKRLEGLVDVYLPDLKFYSAEISFDMARAADYFEIAVKAIEEMYRQQPKNVYDGSGYVTRGVIIRHLVLPSYTEDSKRILDWISNYNKNACVSIMSQYFPAKLDDKFPQLNRRLYKREYKNVLEYFYNLGLSNGYSQDAESAIADYLPSFSDSDIKDILREIPSVF